MRRALIVPLLLVFFLNYGEASKVSTVKGLRYASYKSHTRVVVDIDGAASFTQNRLSNPDRLYFDLKNCILSEKVMPSRSIDDGVLKTVRMAQFNKATVRVVIDLQKFDKFYAFMLENPHRLVIDLYVKKGHSPPQQKNTIVKKKHNAVKTVVIDPGHGGKDPGAIGPRGLKEKDVVLSVAKKLGKILKERHGMKVIYTRKRDVFIPLNERTEIANSKKADLFISIHTNASRKRRTRGIETYFLNWTNDKEATRVAARENAISFKKMQKAQSNLQDLQKIFQSLKRKNKNEESIRLAYSVQNAIVNGLKKDYRKIENLGVKYTLFFVLLGAEMPSILVETSFISNHEEEKRLSRNSYRNKIAEGIARGIKAYITESTLIVNPVRKFEQGTSSPGGSASGGKPLSHPVKNISNKAKTSGSI